MKAKLIMGVILPLIAVILLTFLGSVEVGFSMKKTFNDNINYSEVFKNGYSNNALRIGEIKVTNDYFLPKRFEAPSFLVCVYDKDTKRPLSYAGTIFYNEGEYTQEMQILDVSKASSMGYYGGYDYYGNQNQRTSVEINAHQTKKLQIYYSSNKYSYDYGSDQLSSNRDYDYLILVEKTNRAQSCESLSAEELSDATKISIEIPLNFCSDSDDRLNKDSANDYYNIRNQLSIKGYCTDNLNVQNYDYCSDVENVAEYNCEGQTTETCGTVIYNCKAYGFNACSNGICI